MMIKQSTMSMILGITAAIGTLYISIYLYYPDMGIFLIALGVIGSMLNLFSGILFKRDGQ